MASTEAKLKLKVSTEGEKSIDGLNKSINALAVGGAAAFAALSAVVYKSIEAFADSERGINELTRAMVNNGIYSTDLKNRYLQMAGALEELTGVNDDEIIGAQKILQSYIGQKEITQELLKATLDLAAGKKMSLAAASEIVGKSIGTETDALKKQGIEFDNNTRGAARYESVIAAVEKRHGGLAEEQVKGVGVTKQFHNAVDALLKNMGSRFAPVFKRSTELAIKFIKAITPESAANNLSKLTRELNAAGARLAEVERMMRTDPKMAELDLKIAQQAYAEKLKAVRAYYAQEAALKQESDAEKRETDAQKHQEDLETQIARQEEKLLIQQGNYAVELASDQEKESVKLQNQIKLIDEQIKNEDDGAKKLMLLKQKGQLAQKLFEDQLAKQKVKDQTDTFATIATLQTSSNKTLATIGKAAALTQIAIDTPVAVGKAMSAFPPPFNFAAAAAVGAAMAAQAAKVMGVQLADGGIVMPSAGGTQATIGEGGRAEAVIPLPKNFNPDQGLGGGLTINFNGPLMGDESTATRFAEAIDRKLYDLRKSGNSLAFDEGLT